MKVVVIGSPHESILPNGKDNYTYVNDDEEAIEVISGTNADLVMTEKPIHEMHSLLLQLKQMKHPLRVVILGKGSTYYLLAVNSSCSALNHHIPVVAKNGCPASKNPY